uniref:Uncharacterized protein n=1 Tax=Anguilla anguilla TaxID=7936 RepID=A0A0E9VPK0_ANGAN
MDNKPNLHRSATYVFWDIGCFN